ncbi:hypothetical protein Tco_0435993 [Tanacetum coccineum]
MPSDLSSRLSLIRNHAALKPIVKPLSKLAKFRNNNGFLTHAKDVVAMNTMEFVFTVKLEMEHKSIFQLHAFLTILQIVVNSDDDNSSSDDDYPYGENIDYVDFAYLRCWSVSLEVVEIVDPELEGLISRIVKTLVACSIQKVSHPLASFGDPVSISNSNNVLSFGTLHKRALVLRRNPL